MSALLNQSTPTLRRAGRTPLTRLRATQRRQKTMGVIEMLVTGFARMRARMAALGILHGPYAEEATA